MCTIFSGGQRDLDVKKVGPINELGSAHKCERALEKITILIVTIFINCFFFLWILTRRRNMDVLNSQLATAECGLACYIF